MYNKNTYMYFVYSQTKTNTSTPIERKWNFLVNFDRSMSAMRWVWGVIGKLLLFQCKMWFQEREFLSFTHLGRHFVFCATVSFEQPLFKQKQDLQVYAAPQGKYLLLCSFISLSELLLLFGWFLKKTTVECCKTDLITSIYG